MGGDDPIRRLAGDYSSRAQAYRDLWLPVLLPWGRRLLRAMPLGGRRRVLDLGAGTGALLPEIRRSAPTAAVTGVDLSAGMIRLARGSAALAVADARALPFPAGAFDGAVLAFLLFHLPDPAQALRELLRVLERGGAAGSVTWGPEGELPGSGIWEEELTRQGAGPDPRDPRVVRHDLVDEPGKVEGLFRRAGFSRVRAWSEGFERPWDAQALLAVQGACGAPGRRLASLGEAARAACIARVRHRLAALPAAERVHRAELVFAVAEA